MQGCKSLYATDRSVHSRIPGVGLHGILCAIVILLSTVLRPASLSHSQVQNGEFDVVYNEGLITLSADNVNLGIVLTEVAEETGISVEFPKNLEKRVSIEFYDAPLEEGLRRVLRGVSYALIYSPPDEKGAEHVSGLLVLSDQPRRRTAPRRASSHHVVSKTQEEVRAAVLERYERRLDALERRLTVVEENSPQGLAIRRQILLLEKNIEKLLQE